MNRKGFTLIELLAVIVIIAIVLVMVAPNVIESYNKSKNSSYNILINNIKTAGENYYQECEYGDLSDDTKYGTLACSINNNTKSTTVTLGNLASLDILKTTSINENNAVINPKNNKNISNCSITITKVVGANYKTTFNVDIPENTCFKS